MKMNKINLLIICTVAMVYLFFASSSQGQVGINPGTGSPDPSAALDVDFNDRGILIPRIVLMSSTDVSTISAPATGLLVYNTGAGGLTPAGFRFWDGSEWKEVGSSSGGGGFSNMAVFNSSGTWQVPAGITKIQVRVWGAGGGGGGALTAQFAEGGGGGGYGEEICTVTPGSTLTITVGSGGAGGGASNSNGVAGGSSSVSGLVSPASVSATGGGGGTANCENSCPGAGSGGTSSASVNASGGRGTCGRATGFADGGDAGGGGGMGGVPYHTNNGNNYVGTNGSAPGGGGSGWFNYGPQSGSNNGADGRVIILY